MLNHQIILYRVLEFETYMGNKERIGSIFTNRVIPCQFVHIVRIFINAVDGLYGEIYQITF